ncbi:unnamed protein product [Trichobilharzia szidati]|nr:unnamed protein product [Trichobilharzia szidati]
MAPHPVLSSPGQMFCPSNDISMTNYENSVSFQSVLLNALALADRRHHHQNHLSREQVPFTLNSFLSQQHNHLVEAQPQQQFYPNSDNLQLQKMTELSFLENFMKDHDSTNGHPLMNFISAAANQSENSNTLPFPNFALTASLTKAISTSSGTLGSQVLPICAPLLQLAIRQAINECFPNFPNLHIKGTLNISVNDDQNRNDTNLSNTPNSHQISSATTLYFNEDYDSPMKSLKSKFDDSCVKQEVNGNDSNNCSNDDVLYRDGAHFHSSRRKPLHPSKCFYPSDLVFNTSRDNVPSEQCENGLNLLHINNFTSPLLSTSSPTSPSSDSGVLDLSRSGSLAGSAPITPLKDFNINGNNNNSSNNNELQCNREQDILESYQKQLAAFSQIQAVWKMSTGYNNGEAFSDNFLKFASNDTNSINSSNNDGYNTLQQPHSEPNTPSKGGRRVRSLIGPNGRLTNVRRTSSNRRFPCNQCKEEFPSLHTLEQHTLGQHGTYRCHICRAQFTQRSNLQRHALKHVGFKPFECRVCSKAYYRKDHLMRHMEMGHPGYTPRDNITVHLTSSESLDFLNRSTTSGPETHSIVDSTQSLENNHESVEDDEIGQHSTSSMNHFNPADTEFSPLQEKTIASIPEEISLISESNETFQ